MSKQLVFRCLAIVSLLIVGSLAVTYIRAGYEKGSVVPPTSDLTAVSLTLGDWHGTDLPADPRIRDVLCARDGIDRVYRNAKNRDVKVHAVWTDDYIRLHFPQQCYRQSGWELLDWKDVDVQTDGGDSFPARICEFSQDGQQIQVLYWFALGDRVFLDRVGHRLLRREVCWGQTEWPAMMKFMLETNVAGLGRSEDDLVEVAATLHQELQETDRAITTPEPF
ncbi:MAG: exosortase C-terminal domain/associated protein EpsI [Planctomycetota bacterium]